MKLPKTLAGWCMFLFFLLYGISGFLTAFSLTSLATWTAIAALGAAVFTLIGK